MTTETLEIRGVRGARIAATRSRHGGDSLAVLLPGLRYPNTMPPLHYLRRLLEAKAFDTATVDYRYDLDQAFQDASDDEQLDWIGEDAVRCLEHVIGAEPPSKLVVVAKSLGTIGLGAALEMPQLAEARLIWLTPSLKGTGLVDRMLGARQQSLTVIGTEDPAYDKSLLDDLRKAGIEVVVLDGVNHGLERPGDIQGTVSALNDMLASAERWLFR